MKEGRSTATLLGRISGGRPGDSMPRSDSARLQLVESESGSGIDSQVSLEKSVRKWTEENLRTKWFPLPLIKRVSLFVTGLLHAESAIRGKLVESIKDLEITPAKPESIARRLTRIVDDERLDPRGIMPRIMKSQLPMLLADVLRKHNLSSANDPLHKQNFPRLLILIDESTKQDKVHILVAGLAYQGVTIPLAIETWEQNTELESEDYLTYLHLLLGAVQDMLPPDLRQHVLLIADRAYGRSKFIDMIEGLGWDWLVRIQGQTQIKLSDEAVVAARSLVKHPGDIWCSGFNSDSCPTAIAAFKKAGWRDCQFVAAWAPSSEDPWLLVTNLKATKERLLEYASRWCIERTFLTWKSHGWDIESLQITRPDLLGRYLVGISIATLWTLAAAVAQTTQIIKETLQSRNGRRQVLVQLRLPFKELARDRRPWISKRSLLTIGRDIMQSMICKTKTPPLCWVLPDWNAPVWSIHSQELLGIGP